VKSKTKIKWHKTSEELPKSSCEVVAVYFDYRIGIYRILSVNYSDRYKLFNCRDDICEENIKACRYFSNDVACWAYFDEFTAKLTHDNPELLEVSE
jgi:hypothetical protein